MIGMPKPSFNNKVDEIILRNMFEDMLKGNFPKIGTPTTRCSECTFYGVTCTPSPEYCGCYSGWTIEKNK